MHNMHEIEKDFTLELVPGKSIKGAMKAAGAGSGDLWKVPVGKLRVIENFNVRVHNEKHKERVRWLANSMKTQGFYPHEPFAGFVGRENDVDVIYIFGGHTRLLALDLANSEGAGIAEVPVVAQKDLTRRQMNIALINGNQSHPLEPYEAAIVCRRLEKEDGMSVDQIAFETGYSTEWVNGLRLLMDAPEALRAMVADEAVAATLAIDMIKKHGDKALEKLSEALDRKTAAGSAARVTAKDVDPAAVFNKRVKKSAPAMFSTLSIVTKDPGFAGLSPETQAALKKLFDDLNEDQVPLVDPRQTALFDGGEAKPA